jgi:hypothetical protein
MKIFFTTYGFITNYLADLDLIQVVKTPQAHIVPNLVAPIWIAPPPNSIKVNVDAAVSNLGNGGTISAICRDEEGLFIGASVLAVPRISDPATLEAIACREALALAADLYVTHMGIESDYLQVINLINNPCSFYSVFCEIRYRQILFKKVQFIHESRRLNTHSHNSP